MALSREQMAQRVARELQDGFYVNLGIGIPTLVANYVPEGMEVMLQSENGLLGMGAFPTEDELDADMINAGKQTVTARVGASIFNSAESFAMIRGGHIDLTVLGAFEVARYERRRREVASTVGLGSSGLAHVEGRPPRALDEAEDALLLLPRHERAHRRRRVERLADDHGGHLL